MIVHVHPPARHTVVAIAEEDLSVAASHSEERCCWQQHSQESAAASAARGVIRSAMREAARGERYSAMLMPRRAAYAKAAERRSERAPLHVAASSLPPATPPPFVWRYAAMAAMPVTRYCRRCYGGENAL